MYHRPIFLADCIIGEIGVNQSVRITNFMLINRYKDCMFAPINSKWIMMDFKQIRVQRPHKARPPDPSLSFPLRLSHRRVPHNIGSLLCTFSSSRFISFRVSSVVLQTKTKTKTKKNLFLRSVCRVHLLFYCSCVISQLLYFLATKRSHPNMCTYILILITKMLTSISRI